MWGHPEKQKPTSITLAAADGRVLATGASQLLLPKKELPPLISLDVGFADGARAVSLWRAPGTFGEESVTELTAVPVWLPRGASVPKVGEELRPGVRVQAVETSPSCAMVVVATPHAAADVVSDGRFPCQDLELVLAVEGLPRLQLPPQAREVRHFARYLETLSEQYRGRPIRVAEGLAAAAWRLAFKAGARLALVWVSEDVQDMSRFSLADAVAYGEELGVRTHVWGKGGGTPGSRKVHSAEGLAQALDQLHQELSQVALLWLEGDLEPYHFPLPGARENSRSSTLPSPPLEPTPTFAETTHITVRSVPIYLETSPQRSLEPEELEVREDGQVVRLVSVEPLLKEKGEGRKASLPVVFFFAAPLLAPGSWPPAPHVLNELAQVATALGPVSVVVGNPKAEVKAEALTAAADVRQVLANVSFSAASSVAGVRRHFFQLLEGDWGGDRVSFEKLAFAAQTAAAEEQRLVGKVLASLGSWLMEQRQAGVFFFVADELASDPQMFYREALLTRAGPQERREYSRLWATQGNTASHLQPLGIYLASRGWLVFALSGGGGLGRAGMAEVASRRTFKDFLGEHPAAGAGSGAALRSWEGLRLLLSSAVGDVLPVEGVAQLAQKLQQTWLLSYQVAKAPDGEEHRLDVVGTRPGVEVKAPASVGGVPPELVVEAATRQLLVNPKDGELPVVGEVVVRESGGPTKEGALRVQVDFSSIAPVLSRLPQVTLRLTVAVAGSSGEPFFFHQILPLSEVVSHWEYTAPLRWPSSMERWAVRVEELSTGLWGAVTGELPR